MTRSATNTVPGWQCVLVIAPVLFSPLGEVAAALVRVAQESAPNAGDFDDNVLVEIESFSTALSAGPITTGMGPTH